MNSTDKTHGKVGHRCSTLCGAAMLREQQERNTKARRRSDERSEVRSSDTYTVGEGK